MKKNDVLIFLYIFMVFVRRYMDTLAKKFVLYNNNGAKWSLFLVRVRVYYQTYAFKMKWPFGNTIHIFIAETAAYRDTEKLAIVWLM